MGSEWPIVRLGDHCLKVGSGATPRGGSSVYLEDGDVYLIRSQNVYNHGFNPNGLVSLSEDAADKLRNVSVLENDVLLNITGDSVARACLAPAEFVPARVNQHVAIIRPNPRCFDSRYLRYLLVSPRMQALLLTLAGAGATRNALTKNMIESLEITMPPVETQRAIADKLSALDDKIELNRQTNQTLESMAQALFKSWFVDFDPVIDNALAAGNEIPEPLAAKAAARRALQEQGTDKANQPHTLPDHILQLFPSRFQFTEELGWIPEGWEVSGFETLAKLDTTSVKPNLEPDRVWEHYSIPAFDIDQMPALDSGDDIKSNKYRVNQNAILCSKLNPHVPRIWWFESSNEEAAVCSTEFMQFVPVDPRIRAFLYGLITSKPFQEGIKERVTGSTGSRQRAQPRQVAVMNVLIPSEQLMIAYSEAAEQFLTKQQANRQANLSLGFTRDALLPKLLSGELRIPETKKELDEALA